VALNGARNAGILAAQIIGTTNKPTATRLEAFKQSLKARVEAAAHEAEQKGWRRLL
jgi:5-(carboxyamino)imidazole ribonucleotide mutase